MSSNDITHLEGGGVVGALVTFGDKHWPTPDRRPVLFQGLHNQQLDVKGLLQKLMNVING